MLRLIYAVCNSFCVLLCSVPFTLSVVMLSVMMLSVVMLSVDILSVVPNTAPVLYATYNSYRKMMVKYLVNPHTHFPHIPCLFKIMSLRHSA
jgi:hypothetical protein